jgi:hypothetical protein
MVENDRAVPVVLAAYPTPFAAGRKGFFFMSYSPNIPLPESFPYFGQFCYVADKPSEVGFSGIIGKPFEISLEVQNSFQVSQRTQDRRPSTRQFYQVVVKALSPDDATIRRKNVVDALQENGILFDEGHSPESNMRVILVDNPQSMAKLAAAVTSGNLSFAR